MNLLSIMSEIIMSACSKFGGNGRNIICFISIQLEFMLKTLNLLSV